ncbi:MAG: hypothetical protein EA381_05720 [Planctomycetaceae bacterium]|nr:MAG: hypothetical protein EA381_05720 [Planctomycetaceae bacterium]
MGQVATAEPAIGFYTVEESEFTGWTGGLLILNAGGRPLEFQCTLPVRPTRAHEILYGAGLRDYLIGDAIGALLLSRCRHSPLLVCCDQIEALQLDGTTAYPLGLVCEAAESDEGPITDEMLPGYESLQIAGSDVRILSHRVEQLLPSLERLRNLPDVFEPFSRIREAIGEAQKQVARARAAGAA